MPKVGPTGELREPAPAKLRADRSHVVGPTLDAADRVLASLPRELLDSNREALRRALLTAAWNLEREAEHARICRSRTRV
jgi:hypothetical protein